MFPTATTAALVRKNSQKLESLLFSQIRRCLSNVCDEYEEIGPNRIELKFEPFKTKKPGADPFISMWENPKCCIDPCEYIRHDILFLKEKPKKYTRTWNECEFWETSQYVCDGEIEPPEIEHRTFDRQAASGKPARCTYCKGDEEKWGLIKCMKPPVLTGVCPKRPMPGCPEARDPPKCDKVITRKCCQKRCTQYPSYSECKRPKPKAPRAVECFCLRIPSLCEVFAAYRKFLIK